MKRSHAIACGVAAALAAVIGLPTAAQPVDLWNPTFNNVTTKGREKVAVIDAGVLNVQGQETVAGPLICAGPITGTNITSTGSNGFTSAQGGVFQVSASNTSLQCYGNSTDAASATALKLASNIALTAGTDRYIATLYNDAASTPRARVFSNGTYQNLATVGTAASGTGITASYSGASPFWLHKVNVVNTALAAAATSDVTLAITPANTRISRVLAEVTQVFTGGALSAMTVACGKTAGGNEYLLSNSVFTAQNTWGDVVAEMGAGVVDATRADFGTSAAGVPGAITVQCRFTCTGANCSAATQGNVNFYVEGVTYF